VLFPIEVVVRQMARGRLIGADADDAIVPASPARLRRIGGALRAKSLSVVRGVRDR
jgi:hypothetical protein